MVKIRRRGLWGGRTLCLRNPTNWGKFLGCGTSHVISLRGLKWAPLNIALVRSTLRYDWVFARDPSLWASRCTSIIQASVVPYSYTTWVNRRKWTYLPGPGGKRRTKCTGWITTSRINRDPLTLPGSGRGCTSEYSPLFDTGRRLQKTLYELRLPLQWLWICL